MVHFEILVEDQSGKVLIENLLDRILNVNIQEHSWELHSYRGVGHIPKNLSAESDPGKRLLLNQLPRLLRGYGRSLRGVSSVVVVVVDSDDRDCISFKRELIKLLDHCDPCPNVLYRIAVEEIEAWLLGDLAAIRAAYPRVRIGILEGYVQDSICGTWEILADAMHSTGSAGLKNLRYPEVGKAKCRWAQEIAPHMDVENNRSGSFQLFRDSLREMAG